MVMVSTTVENDIKDIKETLEANTVAKDINANCISPTKSIMIHIIRFNYGLNGMPAIFSLRATCKRFNKIITENILTLPPENLSKISFANTNLDTQTSQEQTSTLEQPSSNDSLSATNIPKPSLLERWKNYDLTTKLRTMYLGVDQEDIHKFQYNRPEIEHGLEPSLASNLRLAKQTLMDIISTQSPGIWYVLTLSKINSSGQGITSAEEFYAIMRFIIFQGKNCADFINWSPVHYQALKEGLEFEKIKGLKLEPIVDDLQYLPPGTLPPVNTGQYYLSGLIDREAVNDSKDCCLKLSQNDVDDCYMFSMQLKGIHSSLQCKFACQYYCCYSPFKHLCYTPCCSQPCCDSNTRSLIRKLSTIPKTQINELSGLNRAIAEHRKNNPKAKPVSSTMDRDFTPNFNRSNYSSNNLLIINQKPDSKAPDNKVTVKK